MRLLGANLQNILTLNNRTSREWLKQAYISGSKWPRLLSSSGLITCSMLSLEPISSETGEYYDDLFFDRSGRFAGGSSDNFDFT